MKLAPAVTCLAFALGACTVGDDYQRPALESWVPAAFGASATDATELSEWWRQLGDEELVALIDTALTNGFDIVDARERLIAARARRGIEDAARLPTLDGELGYERVGTGDEGLSLGGTPAGAKTDIYSMGVVAGWELDLWGRVERLVQAADAEIDVAVEDYRAARVALAAEVARTVMDIRSLDAQLAVVGNTVEADTDVVAITESRARAGFADELAVSRARRTLESTRALLAQLAGDRREAELALAELLAVPAHTLDVGTRPLPRRDIVPALGVPADLLTRRPDVRGAERRLAAATARTGAAEAERYPRVSISGSLGLQGRNTGDIVNTDAYVLRVGPSLSVPILDGGRIDASVALAESDERVALNDLRRTLTAAIAEVETASAQRLVAEDRAAALGRAEVAARDTEDLSLDRYSAGVVDFLDVTEARNQRLGLERERILAERDALVRLVDLYAALGGGWRSADVSD